MLFKTTEPPHRRFSLSDAHRKLSAEFRRKRRLHIQTRSAGCVLSCTYTSGQQEVPTFCLRKKVYQFQVLLWSEHCHTAPCRAPGTYDQQWDIRLHEHMPGTYSDSLPPSSGDIGNPVSRRLVNTSSRPSRVITPPVSVIAHTEHGGPQVKQNKFRISSFWGFGYT